MVFDPPRRAWRSQSPRSETLNLHGLLGRSGRVAVALEALEALCRGHGHPCADADALGRVLALQLAGQVVELREAAALLGGHEQLHRAQGGEEAGLDGVAQLVEPLTGR